MLIMKEGYLAVQVLEVGLKIWFSWEYLKNYKAISFLISWNLWNSRNVVSFKNCPSHSTQVFVDMCSLNKNLKDLEYRWWWEMIWRVKDPKSLKFSCGFVSPQNSWSNISIKRKIMKVLEYVIFVGKVENTYLASSWNVPFLFNFVIR